MQYIKPLLPLVILLLITGCGGSGQSKSKSPIPSSSITSSSSVGSSISPESSSTASSVVASIASSSESSATSSLPAFTLNSESFAADDTIPTKYTCDGVNINPQLNWSNAPISAKSFAVIVDDPDAQTCCGTTWVHWNVYNIDSTATAIAEGASTHAQLMPTGSVEATSDFGSAKYGGPCPPSGKHHYMFTVYALNKSTISFTGPLTRTEFETQNAGDIIDKATMGGYFR